MINTKKYVIRKVIVVATSVLIGVATNSLETVYAHQASETNSTLEIQNNVNKNNKLSNLSSIDSKSIEKSEKVENTISSEDKLLGEIIKEKIDWNLIDRKEFLNYLLSDIKVDKNKETEIKKIWLVKVNELLISHPNNENLQKIKNILEEDLEENNKNKEIIVDSKPENKDTVKEAPKEEVDSEKEKAVSKEEQRIKEKTENNKDTTKEVTKKEVDSEKGKVVSKEEQSAKKKPENKDTAKEVTKKEVDSEKGKVVSKEEQRAKKKPENKDTAKEVTKKEVDPEKGKAVSKEEQRAKKKPENKDTAKEVTKKEVDPEKGKAVSKEEQNNKDKKETILSKSIIQKNTLSSKLSNYDISVSFDKNKINADAIFVASISNKNLNKEIIDKLGDEYKIIEVFEIYFKKDGKKIASDEERTVKVPISKNDSTKLEVYHITENNILEKVESRYSEGVLEFNINHFSKFTILERIRVRAKDLESRTQIITHVKANYEESKEEIYSNTDRKKVENNKKEMEILPKTGLESETAINTVLLALGAIILIRRKQVR